MRGARTFAAWLIGAALGTALVSHAQAGSDTPLRVATSRSPLSLPLFVAESAGLFKAERVQVNLVECVGSVRCMHLLDERRAELATASEMTIVFSALGRRPPRIVSGIVSTHDDLQLITRRTAGVTSVAQLSGKRVGVVAASASHYFLELNLLAHGVDPAQVTIVPMQPENAARRLADGELDAISIWEPFASLARERLGDDAIVAPNAGGYVGTFGLVARGDVAGRRDAEMVRLLRALDRAIALIDARPDKAVAVLRERLGLTDDAARRQLQGMRYRLGLHQGMVTQMHAQARWAVRSGHVPRPGAAPDFSQLLHPLPLRSVRPDAVTVAP